MPRKKQTGFNPNRLADLQRPKDLVPRILRHNPQADPNSPVSATDIRVIGVGGAGNNAVNRMIEAGLAGVEFVVVNTDSQDLSASNADRRILIGDQSTGNLGTGGNPRLGERAANESSEDLSDLVNDADMVFVTAGMGGGTGTGAAPTVAKLASEAGALTIGVATIPFSFEGSRRTQIAADGLTQLESHVDALIPVYNDKLLDYAGPHTSFSDAFILADDMLSRGVQGIANLITTTGLINVDFADVKSVMKDSGTAMMGVGEASGEERALRAVRQAMESPLLNSSIDGARGVLLNVTAAEDVSMAEVNVAAEHVAGIVSPDANIIFGAVVDPNVGSVIRVTLIATGFHTTKSSIRLPANRRNAYPKRIISSDESQTRSKSSNVGNDAQVDELQTNQPPS